MSIRSRLLQLFLFGNLKIFHWKKTVLESNLDIVRPGLSKREKEKFYSELLKNLTGDAADFLTRSKIYSQDNPHFILDEESLPVFQKMKQGGLMLTAHLGNYEAIGPWLVRMKIPLIASYARIKPKWLENQVQNHLRSVDHLNYSLFINNPRDILRLLEKGKLFCLIADQDFRKSHFTRGKFLGKTVHCNSIPQFILRHRPQTPVYLCWIQSNGDKSILFAKELSTKSGEEVFAQFHEWLEDQISKTPQKWYGWIHRRFLSTMDSF